MFLKVQKNLSAGTVEKHNPLLMNFLNTAKMQLDAKTVQKFYEKRGDNYLC